MPARVTLLVIQPITIRRDGVKRPYAAGDVLTMSLAAANEVLAGAAGRVRLVSEPLPEPAPKLNAPRLWPVFWQRANGEIGKGGVRSFTISETGEAWLLVQDQEETLWIRSGLLKTKTEFEAQQQGEGR